MHAKFLANLDTEARKVAKDYIAHPEEYVRQFMVIINGKRKRITTYANSEKGRILRDIHTLFARSIQLRYHYSEHSYAYQRGIGIKDCLQKHIHSDYFFKSDIHKYFDSISFENMIIRTTAIEDIPKSLARNKVFLQACFYDNVLPIGFVSSPILSDIYLHEFDKEMGAREGIVYTRYADDLIFSTTVKDDKDVFAGFKEELSDRLAKEGLLLNHKKTYPRRLRKEGDAIHLLGVNLVKTSDKTNRFTISGKYINETSKKIEELMSGEADDDRALCLEVCGRLEFIRFFSGDSIKKLSQTFKAHTKMDFEPTRATIQKMYESLKKYDQILAMDVEVLQNT